MPPLDPRDHRVTVAHAAEHTSRHRRSLGGKHRDGDHAAGFHADQVLVLLAQKGCASIRIYHGLDADGHRSVVLVGVSRGAGLTVVAAGRLRDSISGVVAVALTQEEEYVRWYRHLASPHPPVMVDVYEYLSELGDLPIAVVQSTRDQYLPAAKAREQFGPDTSSRWLQDIDAADHNFGGARSQMYAAVQSALNWVMNRPAAE